MSKIDPNEKRPFIPVGIAVMTVSDTRTLEDDRSGDTLVKRIETSGHKVLDRVIVRDEVDEIQAQVKAWIKAKEIDVIISTGGTGLTGRDITPEAMRPLFEKEIEGFAIMFQRISYDKIGLSAIQSRALGGVAYGTYIFALPGSTGACKDGWDGILEPQLDYRTLPCNFVEIMPRLDEHLKRNKG
jgi:molybdenum cofactor biosynthesis protein B